MKRKIIKTLSVLFAVCFVFPFFCNHALSANASLLGENSLYVISDNYIYDVTIKTSIMQFKTNFNHPITVYKENGEILTDEDYLSTGCYFEQSSKKYVIIITGDVDYSGDIDSTDYLLVKNYFLGKLTLSDTQFKAADIDSSGVIDSTDFLKIKLSFLKMNFIQSSEEYRLKKELISRLITSANKLSELNDLDATIKADVSSDAGDFQLNGKFLGNMINTSSPNFSFSLNASSYDVVYPVAETYYGNGILYIKDKYSKYKVNATYPDAATYLSNYLTISPVDSTGKIVLLPYVDKDSILGINFSDISTIIDSIESDEEDTCLNYRLKTKNLLLSKYYSEVFYESKSNGFIDNARGTDIFQNVILDGIFKINSEGYLSDIVFNVKLTIKDEAISKLGLDTPKNIEISLKISYENVGEFIQVPLPSHSEYTPIDNIYSHFAFSAYDNVFKCATAVSTSYKETLSFGNVQAYTENVTNIKNVKNGVELYKESNKKINGEVQKTKLYIGNSKYIEETNGSIASMDLNTNSLSVEKTGIFSTPHYESVNNVSLLESFALSESENFYTFDYSLSRDYAISLLENSELAKDYNMEILLGAYTEDDYSIKTANGAIIYSKHTHEVLENRVKIVFLLTDGNSLVYTYDFSVNSTDYDSIIIDNSLLNK